MRLDTATKIQNISQIFLPADRAQRVCMPPTLPLVLFRVLGVFRHLVCAHNSEVAAKVSQVSPSVILLSYLETASLTKPKDHCFTLAGWLANSQDPSLYRPVLIYRPCAVMPSFLHGTSARRHQPSHGCLCAFHVWNSFLWFYFSNALNYIVYISHIEGHCQENWTFVQCL